MKIVKDKIKIHGTYYIIPPKGFIYRNRSDVTYRRLSPSLKLPGNPYSVCVTNHVSIIISAIKDLQRL
jgi:hypothetical protein